MTRMRRLATLVLLCGFTPLAFADKQDSTQPMRFWSDRATLDDYKKTYDYLGKVKMTQGTRLLTADRVLIKQDAAGFHHNTAFGSADKLAYIKQRENDGKGWMEGWAQRIEYDDRTDKFTFYDQARIKTSNDDASGEVIIYDNLTERYQILAKGQAVPEASKPLPPQPAAAPHKPVERTFFTAPSNVPLPSAVSKPVPSDIKTDPDGRAKAVITPEK